MKGLTDLSRRWGPQKGFKACGVERERQSVLSTFYMEVGRMAGCLQLWFLLSSLPQTTEVLVYICPSSLCTH